MSVSDLTLLSGAVTPQFGTVLAFRTVLEYLVYIGALMSVTVLVTLWIATGREPQKHLHRHPHRHRPSRGWFARWLGASDTQEPTNVKRRRRRSHRRRNPTLAETGGLPPIRNQSPSASEHYQL